MASLMTINNMVLNLLKKNIILLLKDIAVEATMPAYHQNNITNSGI